MNRYRCTICNYIYNEDKEGKPFSDLPDTWVCPVCGSPKSVFVSLAEKNDETKTGRTVSDALVEQMVEWGVKYVFGIPGTSTLGVLEAITPWHHYFHLKWAHFVLILARYWL